VALKNVDLLDTSAVAALVAALSDECFGVRSQAADVLLQANIANELISSCQDVPSVVPSDTTLGRHTQNQAPALPPSAFFSADPVTRCIAYLVLGRQNDIHSLEYLQLAVVREPDGFARCCCVKSISRFDEATARTALATLLNDPDPNVRCEAMIALGAQGRAAGDFVDALLAFIADPNTAVQAQAIESMIEIGVIPSEAFPWLSRQLNADSSELRYNSLRAMEIGADSVKDGDLISALDGFLVALESTREESRLYALRILEKLARRLRAVNRPEVSQLIDLALLVGRRDDDDATFWAASVLGILGRERDDVLEWLLQTAGSDASGDSRCAAITALGNVQSRDPRVISLLMRLLSDKNADVRFFAALAIVKTDREASEPVDILIDVLRSGGTIEYRSMAAAALAETRSQSAKRMAALADAAVAAETRVAEAARAALGMIERESNPANTPPDE
jgi:HEAT repeat protein